MLLGIASWHHMERYVPPHRIRCSRSRTPQAVSALRSVALLSVLWRGGFKHLSQPFLHVLVCSHLSSLGKHPRALYCLCKKETIAREPVPLPPS